MEILSRMKDDQYPDQGITHRRFTVRCFLVDQQGRYVIHRIVGNDLFGPRNHLETIGGGIEDNESDEEALRRECLEEVGCTICDIAPLGIVIDQYNLLRRETVSHFYTARIAAWQKERHLTEEEKQFDMTLEFYSLDELEKALNPKGKTKVERLVLQRDFAALQTLLKKRKSHG